MTKSDFLIAILASALILTAVVVGAKIMELLTNI